MRLEEEIWRGNEEGVRSGMQKPPLPLSPAWRFLLLGDGSPTRHLQLLTGEQTQVDVIEMKEIGERSAKRCGGMVYITKLSKGSAENEKNAPEDVRALSGNLTRRQVWLKTSSGQRLAYATSWWSTENVSKHLHSPADPIWVSLAKNRTELYREIKTVYYGHSKLLEEAFGEVGPLWARHYVFWHGGKPLTVIHEVFSPYLATYLGSPIQGPANLADATVLHHHQAAPSLPPSTKHSS